MRSARRWIGGVAVVISPRISMRLSMRPVPASPTLSEYQHNGGDRWGVSPLVGLVAAAVPAGGRVLVATGEFTSLTWPFAAQAGRGVVVTEAPLTELADRAADHDGAPTTA
jgi:hypothetical protein